MSIAEMEYRKAVETNKPRLLFLLHEDAAWPVKFIDDDKTRIKKLRAELEQEHTVSHFKSAAELSELIGPAIHNWLKEHSHIGPHTRLIEESDGEVLILADHNSNHLGSLIVMSRLLKTS